MTNNELRAARATLGLTQVEMARAMNTTQPHYADLEAGRKQMSGPTTRVVELLLAHPRTAKRLAAA